MFQMEYESKLLVPNKWDDPKLDLCIPIEELVKPLHKKIFQRPLENHKDWSLPSPLSFLLITKKIYFIILFSFVLLGILFIMLCCFSN